MELGSDQRQWLVEAQSLALYVPPGHLLFAREGTLLAQTFDFRTARLSGEPVPVAVPIDHNPTGALASFAVSADGNVLTYRGGFSTATELVRFDGAGVRQGAIGQASDWSDIKLSPDGSRAALVTTGRASGHREIWLVEIATGRLQLWSTERSNDWHPVWSPDGHDLAFASDRSGASAVFRRAVDSSGENNLIAAAAGPAAGRFPEDWSSGDHLVINQDTPNATTEIWLTTASGTGEPRLLKRGGRQTGGGRISPDGRWLAYVSDESGAFEVYVSSLDGFGQVPRLERRRRPSAMAGGRARAAVHRRGSSVDVCFRRVRRHLQDRITQATLCILFDQVAQFLRGRLRARRGRIDLLAVPGKWQCTRRGHGHRRLAGGTSYRGQVSSRPAWIRRMT